MSGEGAFSYASENHVLLGEILKYFPMMLSKMSDSRTLQLNQIPRQEFYQRTRRAYATIHTTDPRMYAGMMIKKGVVVYLETVQHRAADLSEEQHFAQTRRYV